jgi:hypothetical protein
MANEVTVSGTLSYLDAVGASDFLQVIGLQQTITSLFMTRVKESVGTSSVVAVPLGGVSAPGWAVFKNEDPTNTVNLYTAVSGGKQMGVLPPGGFAILMLGSDAQAPAWQALVSPCVCSALIIST